MGNFESMPKTAETEKQKEGQQETSVAVLEITDEQIEQYADQAVLETDQEVSDFSAGAEERIEASAKTMGISGELAKEARTEQGLDKKLWQVKSEARTIQMAAKLDIKDILGELNKEDPVVAQLKETLDAEIARIDKESQEGEKLLQQIETEQERKARDVGELMKKHDCLFVHMYGAFGETKTGTAFRQGEVKIATQVKILLGLEPTISTSSIRKDQNERNTAGRSNVEVGVLLSGGRIDSASPQDSRSVPKGRGKRETQPLGGPPKYPLESKEAVDFAIQDAGAANPENKNLGKYYSNYNELVMEKPKVAGIFLALKESKIDSYSPEGFDKLTFSGKIPVYAMEKGVLYKVEVDKTGKESKFVFGEVAKPEDILKNTPEFTDQEKDSIISELSENLPFKTESMDFPKVEGFTDGQKFYIREQGMKIFKENLGKTMLKPEKYVPDEGESWSSGQKEIPPEIKNGEDFYQIGGYKTADGETSFFAVRNKEKGFDIYKKEKKLYLGEKLPHEISVTHQEHYEIPNPFDEPSKSTEGDVFDKIGFGVRSWTSVNVRRSNLIEDYLNNTREAAKTTVEEPDDKEYRVEKKKVRHKMAYHAYGFGVQAGKFGEKDVQERAFQLAAELDPDENFEKVIEKRLGEMGGYRGTEKEARMEEGGGD